MCIKPILPGMLQGQRSKFNGLSLHSIGKLLLVFSRAQFETERQINQTDRGESLLSFNY
jgi:hypothetical protein